MKQSATPSRAKLPPAWLARARLLTGWDHHPLHAVASPLAASRRRLVLVNLAVVSLILVMMAFAVYITDTRAMRQQIDGQLVRWAQQDWAADYLNSHGGGDVAADQDGVEQYEPSSPNLFALVLDAHGHVLYDPARVTAYGLPDLAAARPVLEGTASSDLSTATLHGVEFRLYSIPLVANGHSIGVLQTGASLESAERQANDLLAVLGLVGLGVLLLTALASVYLANQAMEPMRLAFERQRQFAAAASHELRTPLAVVRSQAELVARRLARAPAVPIARQDADDLRADVVEIVAEVDYMSRLVRDLLVLARSGGAGAPLHRQMVDMGALAEDAVARVHGQAEARGVHLALEVPAVGDGPPPALVVVGDVDRLRQLALILLENAIRYTPSGGAVTVAVAHHRQHALLGQHGDQISLSVRDTGIGIAGADLPRIFEPFYRATIAVGAGAQPAEEHGSAGLGLALARWIVEAHGGDLTVESEVGSGSVFTVTLAAAHEGDRGVEH